MMVKSSLFRLTAAFDTKETSMIIRILTVQFNLIERTILSNLFSNFHEYIYAIYIMHICLYVSVLQMRKK